MILRRISTISDELFLGNPIRFETASMICALVSVIALTPLIGIMDAMNNRGDGGSRDHVIRINRSK